MEKPRVSEHAITRLAERGRMSEEEAEFFLGSAASMIAEGTASSRGLGPDCFSLEYSVPFLRDIIIVVYDSVITTVKVADAFIEFEEGPSRDQKRYKRKHRANKREFFW